VILAPAFNGDTMKDVKGRPEGKQAGAHGDCRCRRILYVYMRSFLQLISMRLEGGIHSFGHLQNMFQASC